MDENYLLAAVRYVERNPGAAKLCVHPEDWKGSSASAHLEEEDDTLVRVRPMLDRVDRWSDYLLDTGNGNESELIELHARTGRPLGSPDFIRRLETITGEDLAPKRPGRKPAIFK